MSPLDILCHQVKRPLPRMGYILFIGSSQQPDVKTKFHLLLESQTRVTHWQPKAAKKGNKFLIGRVGVLTTKHLRVLGTKSSP